MPISLRLGEWHPCPYRLDQQARLGWIEHRRPLTPEEYSALLAAGCRRSGEAVYRPVCRSCEACIPVRVPAADFAPNRSQSRTWARNADLRVIVRPACFSEEHYALYLRYQQGRHPGEVMAAASQHDYMAFLACNWMETWFVEFRRGRRLLAVAVVDALDDGLSAVYTFFDPDDRRSGLGTYAVLYQIQLARQSGLAWCYLGYWISESRKMNYKQQFRPLEARLGSQWLRVGKGSPLKLATADVL